MQNQCAEIKIRAERRMGELLPEQIRKQGERDQTLHDERFDKPKLKEMGLDYSESHRYQQIASVPEVAVSTASDMLNNHDWCLVRWNNHRINK